MADHLTMRLLRNGILSGLLLAGGSASALDLLESYRIALNSDANFLAARAMAESSRELLPQARAGLLPQISATASRSKNDTTQTSENPLTGQVNRRSYEYDGENKSLNLRQPLIRLGNVAHYLQAGAQVAAAEATLEKDTQDMALRVSSAYFESLNAQARLEAVLAQKDAYAAQLSLAERSLKAGYGTRTDVDEAKARYELSVAQEIEAGHLLKVAERSLAGILNRSIPSGSLAGIDPKLIRLELPQPDNLDEWLSRGAENNPELRALQSNVEAAQREVDKGRAAHLPTLDLVASRSNSLSDSVTTVGNEYWTTSIGLQLNVPIFSGGQINSAIRQAHANLERMRQQYEAARRQLEVNVVREYGAVSQGVARVRALEQALQSAEQVLVSTRRGVQAGTRNTVDILNAVQQLTTARVDLAQARMQYALARLKLEAATGSLDESDIEEINRWLNHGAGS